MKNFLKLLGSIVIGVVIGIILVLALKDTAPTQNVGGVVSNSSNVFSAGAQFGGLPVQTNWGGGKIGPKTNTATWKNTTGQTAYVDLLEVATDGTASSTYTVYAYATTSSAVSNYSYTPPVNSATTAILINGAIIATSTVATSTSNLINSPTGVVVVPANSYLNILLSQRYNSPCTGSVCESATSTNRGFNLQWRLRYNQ